MKKKDEKPQCRERRSPGGQLLSMFLALCMILTLLPVSAMAEEIHTTIGGSGEIISFAPLTETTKAVSLGTSIEDLELPEALTATVRTAVPADENSTQDSGDTDEDTAIDDSMIAATGSAIETEIGVAGETGELTDPEGEETIVDISVTWSSPDYDPDSEGEYVFTPVIEGYTVRAELPEITVTVDAVMMRQVFRLTSTGDVAQIDETGYATLQEAVNAVGDNQTIQLLEGISLTETVTISSTDNKSFTLDLNGKTISNSSEVSITIQHDGNGNLTIQDSGSGGKIQNLSINAGHSTIKITANGSVTLLNGTIESSIPMTIDNRGSGDVIVSGGKIKSDGPGVALNSAGSGRVLVSGGTVESAYGIAIARAYGSSGKIIISGTANIVAKSKCIYLNGNESSDPALEITGGTLTHTGATGYVIDAFSINTVLVKGGTLESTQNTIIGHTSNYGSTFATVKINIPADGRATFKAGEKVLADGYTLTLESARIIVASEKFDGTDPVSAYNPNNIGTYKYLEFEPTTALTGTATISNTAPRIGDTLTGSLVSGNNTGTLTYVWKAEGNQVGTGESYTVTSTDLWKAIELEITSSAETGTVSSTPTTAVVKKAAPSAPEAPTLVSKTHNSVTLASNTAYDFSKDASVWQSSNVFGGLTANTAYTFYQRVAETADTEHSTVSAGFSVTTDAVTHTITADPTSENFGSLIVGYSAPAAQTITIRNTGNSSVALTQPSSTNYTIGALSTTTLAANGTATFTVTPKAGLAVGNYNETLTISTNHSTNTTVNLSFSVTAVPTYSITADPNTKDFDSLTVGYSAPAAQTITIRNTGNSSVALTQPSSTNYTIGALSTTTLAANGTATFTVTPKAGLAVGNYNETLTISTNHSTNATVNLSFSVTTVPTYLVTFNPNGGTVSEDSRSVVSGIAVGELPTPIRSGSYSFNGWYTAASGGTQISASTTVSANVTYYAHWTYIGGGGSGSDGGSSSNDNSSSVIVTAPTPEKPNSPTQGEIKVPGTVDSKGNVTVNITDKTVTNAFDKALADARKNGNEQNGITVVLRVITGSKTGSNVTVNLPKTLQNTIIAEKIVNTIVVVDSPDIRVGMDLATVQEINKQANSDVNITATRTDSGMLTGDAKEVIGSRPVFDLKVNYGNSKQVHSFGAGSVSITIPYVLAANEEAGNVQAVYVDEKGMVHWLVNSVYDSTEQVLRFATSHFSTYGIGYKQAHTAFTDIADHWAREDIEFVVSRGLFSGTSGTTFSPNTAMTRGMFVTVLGRLANADVSIYKESSFTDVKSDANYMGSIEWARKNSIVSGTGNGNFVPDQSITREQMAVVIQNYAKLIGFTLPKVHEENTFNDSVKISAYARDAVEQLQMAGVISEKKGNLFDPQGTATRAEISAVLRHFVELVISSETMQGWTRNDSGQWMYYENAKPVTGKKDIGGTAYTFDQYGVTADLPKNLKYTTYTVQEGDSFWIIAHKLGCTMSELERLNNKSRFALIHPGDVLRVPEKLSP